MICFSEDKMINKEKYTPMSELVTQSQAQI